jgi:hypothetical protein
MPNHYPGFNALNIQETNNCDAETERLISFD